jgi:hypothetical protein
MQTGPTQTLLVKSFQNRAPSGVTRDRVLAGQNVLGSTGARVRVHLSARRSLGPHSSTSPAPSFPRHSAMPLPMPVPPLVTTAVLPSKRIATSSGRYDAASVFRLMQPQVSRPQGWSIAMLSNPSLTPPPGRHNKEYAGDSPPWQAAPLYAPDCMVTDSLGADPGEVVKHEPCLPLERASHAGQPGRRCGAA